MGILVSWISSTFSGQGPGIATFHQPTTRNSDDSLSRPPLGSTNSSVPAFSSIATQPVPSCETEQRCHVPYADSTLSMQVLATPLAPPTIQECENETYGRTEGLATPNDYFLEDEGLSALEKIYLFSQSNASFHRIYIARSLPSYLVDVSPPEAIEYVIPLMNGLAMDDDDPVKEALVESLYDSIWWFITSCRVVEVELLEEMPAGTDALPAQSFTPLLGTLLLSPNVSISASTRQCIVQLVQRIRNLAQRDETIGSFGVNERQILEKEILDQLVIGMAHLELDSDAMDEDLASGQQTSSSQASSATDSSLSSNEQLLQSISSTGDTGLLTVLSPSAMTRTQLEGLDEGPRDEPEYPLTPTSDRPPSPVPAPWNGNGVLSESQTESTEALLPIVQTCLPSSLPPSVPSSIPSSEWNGNFLDEQRSESSEQQNAIGRLASMSLMAAVTASTPLDREVQESFVNEVERASHDPVHWVRREATFTLGALAKVVPDELVVSLLQMLDAFCDDPVWNVRQSVLFALPAVLSRLPTALKRAQALKTVQKLVSDPAVGVRKSVLEVLGELIYAFRGDEGGPPKELLSLFLGEESLPKKDGSHGQSSGPPWINLISISLNGVQLSADAQSPLEAPLDDPARALICAFNLPAVILTLGPRRWGELRGTYLKFAQMEIPGILRTLAASIGEVARIIGPEQAHTDLVHTWLCFAKFKDSMVRLKSLESLEGFLGALNAEDRLLIVSSLEDIWTNHLRSWKKRELLAQMLGSIASSFVETPQTLGRLLRLAFRDGYATVRNAGVKSHATLRNRADLPDELREVITTEVNLLASDESYRGRQLYVECQNEMFSGPTLAANLIDISFLKAIKALAADKVANVRIGVARLLLLVVEKIQREHGAIPQDFIHIALALSNDSSSDVRAFVSGEITTVAAGSSVSSVFSRPPPLTH